MFLHLVLNIEHFRIFQNLKMLCDNYTLIIFIVFINCNKLQTESFFEYIDRCLRIQYYNTTLKSLQK